MSKNRFVKGLLLGGIFGAIAGILTAPKSGKETREDLKKKADEIGKNTEKAAKEAGEKVGEFVEEAKVKTDAKVEEMKVEASKLQKRALNTVEGAKKGFEKKV
ncbi:MAG: YtxH domain-containing protein [bacterium]|nr:YtxH domain-containing protein [bacterium]